MGTHCRLYSGGSWLLDMNVLTSSEGLAHAAWPAACRGAVHDPKTPRQGSLSIVCHRWRPSVPSVGQHPAPPTADLGSADHHCPTPTRHQRQSQVDLPHAASYHAACGAVDDDPDSTFGHFRISSVSSRHSACSWRARLPLPQPAALLVHCGARPNDRRTQMLPRHRDGQHRAYLVAPEESILH
jgi:hypothetical protein